MNISLGQHARRWGLLTPIAVLGLVFLLLMARAAERDDNGTPPAAVGSVPAGRLYLAPTGLAGRYHLLAAETDPQREQAAGIFRAFGRRAPDGLALEASAVITVPGDLASLGSTQEPTPLEVLGQEVALWTDPTGVRSMTWNQGDGTTAGVMTWGLTAPDMVALATSLLTGDAATAAPALPPLFVPVHSGEQAGGIQQVSLQNWQADDGTEFGMGVLGVPGVATEDLGWYVPGGHAVQVRGTRGVFSSRHDSVLMWIERPGVVVTMQGIGIAERDVLALAESLRPLDEAAWRALRSQTREPGHGVPPSHLVTPVGPVKVMTAGNRYFVIRPVEQRSSPPCPSRPSGQPTEMVAETSDGREVACYQVGPPLVTADDVSGATARRSAPGVGWEVEFTVTSEGAARFRALIEIVRSGSQVAILVDDVLVSLPRVTPGAELTKGVVNGLDEQTARHLADRLEHGR
jgi:hypothetical protein